MFDAAIQRSRDPALLHWEHQFSLLRRQLNFLAGDDGLDFGSPALRGMLDTFASQDVLTEGEVAGLKSLAVYPAPVTHTQVARALQGAAE